MEVPHKKGGGVRPGCQFDFDHEQIAFIRFGCPKLDFDREQIAKTHFDRHKLDFGKNHFDLRFDLRVKTIVKVVAVDNLKFNVLECCGIFQTSFI